MAEQTPEHLYASQQALTDREQLVEQYRPYVFSIARQVSQSFPMRVDFEELVGYGMVGLLEAADRYDPRRKISFLTFSHYRIKGEIFDGLRRMGILTRTPHEDWARRESALNDLIQTASDDDTEIPGGDIDDEIQSITKLVDSLIPAYFLSISDKKTPVAADTRELPYVAVELRETLKIVHQIIEELPAKEREIIKSLYFKQLTTTDIANQMGVNKSWVSRLHSKAIEHLREILTSIGVLPD